MPKSPFRKHHLVRENRRLVELAVSVGVFQSHDAVRRVFNLFRNLCVGTRRVRDVKPALLVEGDLDGPVHQGWSGNDLDSKAIGHGERVVA